MPYQDNSARAHRDAVVITTLALMAIGMVTVASAGASLDRSLWDSLRWSVPFGRQTVYGLLGLTVIIGLTYWFFQFRALAVAGIANTPTATTVAGFIPPTNTATSTNRGSELRGPLAKSSWLHQ